MIHYFSLFCYFNVMLLVNYYIFNHVTALLLKCAIQINLINEAIILFTNFISSTYKSKTFKCEKR